MTSPELAKRILLCFGVQFSSQKVRRLRWKLGWVPTGTKYCQLIREPNRVKRLEFSEKCLRENEQFNDVIFTDECSVLLENHSKISFHQRWEQRTLKGKPKHPVKVHVWAGISKRGPTHLIVFEGIMVLSFTFPRSSPTDCSHSSEQCSPTVIASSKITTRNIPAALPAASRKNMELIGGRLRRNRPISTQSNFFGTS